MKWVALYLNFDESRGVSQDILADTFVAAVELARLHTPEGHKLVQVSKL